MQNIYMEGIFLNASLILGLGAQNILVMNSGLNRQHPALIAGICSLCDLLLILIGVAGAATIFIEVPILKIIIGIVGVLFLFVYALTKLREGIKSTETLEENSKDMTAKKAVILALSFSLLNPHVYLDTVILIGGFAAKYQQLESRLYFGAGAASFSFVWFFSIAFLSSAFHKILAHPKALRIINILAGTILAILSIKLSCDVYEWIISLQSQ